MNSKRRWCRQTIAYLLLLMAVIVCPAYSEESFRTSALISDNMVIQRDMAVPLWGWADPGERITATFNNQTASAVANAEGKWQLKIGPFKSGGPYDMQLNGAGAAESSKTISNVLVGDVWIASGQSNMRMSIGPAETPQAVMTAEEIAAANYPDIRMFGVGTQAARYPVDDVQGAWRICSPQTVASLSATAFFFARDLQQEIQVPIGIINNSVGGRAVQAFMSRQILEALPGGKETLDRGDIMADKFAAGFQAYMQQLREWEQGLKKAEAEGLPTPNTPAPIIDKNLLGSFHGASRLYNGMVAPVIPYGIRGFLWYQGETNAVNPANYEVWFPALIREWREKWGQGDLPFLYVQLPNYGKPGGTIPNSWSIIREAQLQALEVPETAMAIAIDVGESENIHPRNKQAVGHRLALAALAKAYGKQIPCSGPIYGTMKVEGSKVRLGFMHADGGLRAKDSAGNLTVGAPLAHFIIAGPDQQFAPAQAKLEGDTVIVWADAVKEPLAVRYAWSNDPVGCNLYNGAGLPASPFRTDQWALPMKAAE